MIGDLGRYLFWVKLRDRLDPSDRPALLRVADALAAARWHGDRRRGVLFEELRRSFPERGWSPAELRRTGRDAADIHAQCMVEELGLGRLSVATIDGCMRYVGHDRLQAALSRGRGVILVYPHAGAVMLMIARLALSGYRYTQVAARGFAPIERQNLGAMRDTWLNRAVRAAREADEDRLPVRYHVVDQPARLLFRDLDANGIVAVAYDGRGGAGFEAAAYLGRRAFLATGAWRLALATGAAVVPAFCERLPDRTWALRFGDILVADGTLDAAGLRDRFLRDHAEPWLRANPAHYAPWLAHCRRLAGVDDHPLFPAEDRPVTGRFQD